MLWASRCTRLADALDLTYAAQEEMAVAKAGNFEQHDAGMQGIKLLSIGLRTLLAG